MAKQKRPKEMTVQQFGGTDHLGDVKAEAAFDNQVKDVDYDVRSIEAKSQTKIEDDEGYGNAIVIRTFTFGVNPAAFAQHRPTKQELFNSHFKGIEAALWRDGLKVVPEQNPQVVVSEDSSRYQIIVGAMPMRGHTLYQQPQTLKEIVHG